MAASIELSTTESAPGLALDRASIADVDSTGQIDAVLDLPSQLRDALRRVAEVATARLDAPGGLIVAGMGGSGVGARLALSGLGTRLSRPLTVSNAYALPGWAGPQTLVFCSSYSGTTAETLAAYADAKERGAPRLVATTGGELDEWARRDGVPVIALPRGYQPRAAVGYSIVSALTAAALSGAAPVVNDEVERAAALLEELSVEWGPAADEDSEAKALARALHGTLPVIAGAEIGEAAAYRWKCQFNENAEVPAFASALPEADHNEVVGWTAARDLGRLSYVSLEDPGARTDNLRRIHLTEALAADGVATVCRVRARGETRLERLLSLVLLGDLVSVYAAVLRGADPIDIPAIDVLKTQMASA
jgi:glucose/mannose-6-phosphate isomerase